MNFKWILYFFHRVLVSQYYLPSKNLRVTEYEKEKNLLTKPGEKFPFTLTVLSVEISETDRTWLMASFSVWQIESN